MEYKVVKEKSIGSLELTVNDLIVKGWHPQGGVSCGSGSFYKTTAFRDDYLFDDIFYLQAMIKEKENNDEKH